MQDKRFQPSGLNSHFQQQHLSFQSYIQHARKLISAARTDLNQDNHERVIEANAPFEFQPSDRKSHKGILLVHGLFDSPYTMRALGKHLQAQGFWVRAILLPGHGTVPGDLLETTYQDWINAVRYGVNSFLDRVDAVYLAGFSTGGTLGIHLAQQGCPLAGLLLFAPAIKIKSRLAPLTQWHHRWRCLGQRSQWFSQHSDSDYSRYESIAFNPVKQIYGLTRLLQQHEENLSLPIMAVSTSDDEVVSHKAIVQFMQRQTHDANRLLVYGQQEQLNIPTRVHSSHYPEQHIINFSHQSLLLPNQDLHYGEHGDYQDFRHYNALTRLFGKAQQPPLYRGAVSIKLLREYYITRLTYNPDFANMLTHVDQFFNDVV